MRPFTGQTAGQIIREMVLAGMCPLLDFDYEATVDANGEEWADPWPS